jgi:hypothetical protein
MGLWAQAHCYLAFWRAGRFRWPDDEFRKPVQRSLRRLLDGFSRSSCPPCGAAAIRRHAHRRRVLAVLRTSSRLVAGWHAPLPILCLAPKSRTRDALAIAFAMHALAGLNFWNPLRSVVRLPLWLELAAILIPAACFAFAVVLYRGWFRKGNLWLAALAFSVVIVATVYLFSLSQGTLFNPGYPMLENLFILQVRVCHRPLGNCFTVNLLPAAVAARFTARAKLRLRIEPFIFLRNRAIGFDEPFRIAEMYFDSAPNSSHS